MSYFFNGPCYWCICTVCSSRQCPYRYSMFKHCQRCHDSKKGQSPLKDCDSFCHVKKHRSFRFRPSERLSHSGTYILYTDRSVLVGSYDKLFSMRNRLGGVLKPIDYISFLTGEKPSNN